MTPNYKNKDCTHCSNAKPLKKSITSTLLSWLGLHEKCNQCGSVFTKNWNIRAILLLVCSILFIQVLASLILYPIVQFLVPIGSIQILFFVSIHVLLIPFYLKAAFTFLLLIE